jgi:hypothetical protein
MTAIATTAASLLVATAPAIRPETASSFRGVAALSRALAAPSEAPLVDVAESLEAQAA